MRSITGRDVVERIVADIERRGFAWDAETIDGFKAGDPDRPVRGIASTWMATQETLAAAVAVGCDLVVTHEPTFWDHFETPPAGAAHPWYRTKRDWIASRGTTIWRFHDHHHMAFPRDPVLDAFFDRLGWLPGTSGNSVTARTELPPVRLGDLARQMSAALGTRVVRVIGAPTQVVSRIGYGIHDLASALDAARDCDVVVVGELREWDAFEYFRDAGALGRDVALIVISHAALETWGSTALVPWLAQLVPEIPVRSVLAPEPYVLRRAAI